MKNIVAFLHGLVQGLHKTDPRAREIGSGTWPVRRWAGEGRLKGGRAKREGFRRRLKASGSEFVPFKLLEEPRFMPKSSRPLARWLGIGGCLIGVVVLASCSLFQHQDAVMAPPTIPGAEYVGTETCIVCHTKQAGDFRGAVHAAFYLPEGVNAKGEEVHRGEGCESCHGPGSLHIAGRGDKSKIVKGDWRTCTGCHLEKAAKLHSRFHHPIAEGRMSCTACHDPHSARRPVFRTEENNNKCFECHPDKKGPWTFTHDAVTEDGCTACHDPHGSNVDKMLVANPLNLCLRCHFDITTYPSIGTHDHKDDLPRGGCENCHRGIHGSNFSQHLRF
jgi:predicted CXXCH cytochrome family protein